MIARASLIVLGVFTHEDRYLVIQEKNGTWYLPAGKVDEGENLVAAVIRETAEEAGQLVGIAGILGIEHVFDGRGACLRFVFAGWRGILVPPKDVPDEHSLRAAWLTRQEIARLPLRHPEVLTWIDRHAAGAPLLPTNAYGVEGQERRVPFEARSGRPAS
jgi:8-oxo-dGTP pyrophosphatase MutT (NUDIX family)